MLIAKFIQFTFFFWNILRYLKRTYLNTDTFYDQIIRVVKSLQRRVECGKQVSWNVCGRLVRGRLCNVPLQMWRYNIVWELCAVCTTRQIHYTFRGCMHFVQFQYPAEPRMCSQISNIVRGLACERSACTHISANRALWSFAMPPFDPTSLHSLK